MKKYNIRITAVILIITIILALFSACADSNKKDSKTENLFVMPEMTGKLLIYKYSYYDNLIDAAVKIYQNEYPNVEVKIFEFGDEYYDTLKTEVAAGKGPDVWIGTSNDFDDIYKTADTGVFEDLKEFMKTDGTNWNLYNKMVLDGGIYKSKQYFLPIGYQVNILMTTEEIMREEKIEFDKIKTASDLMKTIRQFQQKYTPQEKCLFREPESSQRADSWLSHYFPWSNIAFINYETGNIINDSETFRNVADAVKWAYTDEFGMVYSSYGGASASLISKEKLFVSFNSGDPIGDFYLNYGLLDYYCKPLFMAFPDIDGKVTASVELLGAVFKNSNNKLNAYNFLKILLSERIQASEILDIQLCICVPVTKSAIKIRIDEILERQTEVFKDEPWQHFNESGYIDKWSNPLPKEEAEKFSDMLINIDHCVIQPVSWTGMFNKSFKPYFEDKKTYEQCFDVFKNNLELYFSE